MQQTMIAPTKLAVDSAPIVVQTGAAVCIAMFTQDGKRPSETDAFSLVQVAGGPWPGELPEVVKEGLPTMCVVQGTDWWPVTYIVRKGETDEAIGVLVET
jgi:hypothetical protein